MIAIWNMKYESKQCALQFWLVNSQIQMKFYRYLSIWLFHTCNYYFILTFSSSIKPPKCVKVIIKTNNVIGIGPSLSEENECAKTLVRVG